MKKFVGIVIGMISISLVGCIPRNDQMKENGAIVYKDDLENGILDENTSYTFHFSSLYILKANRTEI